MPKKIFPEENSLITKAPLLRRLTAMLYDTLICAALMLVTTGVYTAISHEFTGQESTSGDPLLSSILFITLYLFFGYFWTRSGQTLGMQVWHLRIQNEDSTSISWLQALLRFMMAIISFICIGAGYIWMLIDKDKKAWHDRFSESVVVRIPKKKG
jgi:uncharacterized RDD family membrane protein YckC